MILHTFVTKKEIIVYIITIIIALTFSQVFEVINHNVYSNYMNCALTIPLIGLIALLLLLVFKIKTDKLSRKLITISLETLTIGSILKGSLEILGNLNKLVNYFLAIGFFILLIGIIKMCIDACINNT